MVCASWRLARTGHKRYVMLQFVRLEELFVPVALAELFPSRATALILKLKQEHDRSLPQEEIR